MYEKYLVTERIRPSTGSISSPSILQIAESDRARVIYSAALRRLQGKTQVFPLDDNDAVRTRLTHSLEVAHVGRYLTTSVLRKLNKEGRLSEFGLDDPEYSLAFASVVETACLLHDIGNPPFGHFGESAISKWFSNFDKQNTSGIKLTDRMLADFLLFDGNPQGFRIVSCLSGEDGASGLNLSLSQLAATLKYVCLPSQVDKDNSLLKKPGVFHSEQEILEKITTRFSLDIGQRHPLAYLMEAADDISYCLSDIEDGIEKKILLHQQVVEDLKNRSVDDKEVFDLVNNAALHAKKYSAQVSEEISFRTNLINALVEFGARTFIEQHTKITSGAIPELIDEKAPEGRLLKLIKSYVAEKLYSHPLAEGLELSGFAVIQGLLGHFGQLVKLFRDDFSSLSDRKAAKKRGLDAEYRLLSQVARRYRKTYEVKVSAHSSDADELWHRSHLIVDHISGMTDFFALTAFQKLSGIRL